MNRALRSALPRLSGGLKPLVTKCASAKCRPHRGLFSLSFRTEGTQINDNWYCGPDCFEEAARDQLEALCSAHSFGTEPRRPRLPLGLTALSLGYITPEQLQSALEHQRQNGGRIGEILISLNYATQAQIASSLATQWGYPVLSLRNRRLQVPQRIPIRLMELYSMLPVHFVAQTNKLVVGFAELVDCRILSTIEAFLNCTVIPCFITRDEFDSHFQAARLQPCNDEVVFDRRSSIQEIASITRSYASQIGAVSASFGMCRDYVWSRLQGTQAAVDLLSRI